MRLFISLLALLTCLTAAQGEEYRYERMSPGELRRAIERCPVAFIPAGICEWHGDQSAVGLDALKAETLCRMAARSLGGVCFPTVWLGPDASTAFNPEKYPRGTMTIEKELYYNAAEQILADVEKLGFRVAVYLSGHYPGVVPPVAKKFNARGGMKVLSISENLIVEGIPSGDHAATWETSMLMALRPGLVDLSRLPPLSPTTRPAGEVIPPPWPFLQRNEYYGVYGADPRVWATAWFGRKGTEAIMDGLVREVGRLLGDASYGKDRSPLVWPDDERGNPEVRYDFQLPREWLERFRERPIVYWPVTTASDRDEGAVRRAIALARTTGGMVFPQLSYGPDRSGTGVDIPPDLCSRVIDQVLNALADMDFRVVVVVPGAGLEVDRLEALKKRTLDGGQTILLTLEAGPSEAVPAALSDAIEQMIPPKNAATRALNLLWRVNGGHMLSELSEAIYAPPAENRVYEHTFELTDAEASSRALLDLGTVRNHCEVILNGAPALVDHWPPYRFVVTGQLQAGKNTLKVVVRHKLQPTVDWFFYRPGSPEMKGPVTLTLWGE